MNTLSSTAGVSTRLRGALLQGAAAAAVLLSVAATAEAQALRSAGAPIGGVCVYSENSVVTDSRAGIGAFEELAQLKQSMDADMRAARDKLVADERSLTSRQGQIPAAEFNAGTADLLKRAQDLAALTRTRESQVTRTWDGVVAQIRQAAQGQMNASAAAHHCAMILDRGAGYHVGSGMDLTADVTQRLNGVMPSVNLQLAPPT
jgi:Skp family chaperone for outer membrane proteins